LPSIQGLAPHRTIYVGTLSRVLFPSLRLGYVIVPEDVLDAFEHARALVDRQSSSRMQAAVARFINDGEFDRHLRKMHNVYVGRREALFHHADHLLQGLLSLRRDSSGLHVVGFLPPDSDDVAAEETAARHGIDVSAMSPFVSETTMPPSLILGYGVVPEQAMEAAVAELARALTSSLCGSS
jgi:GntR family transcriptional regulator/MocR family aminotransferase